MHIRVQVIAGTAAAAAALGLAVPLTVAAASAKAPPVHGLVMFSGVTPSGPPCPPCHWRPGGPSKTPGQSF